MRRLAFLCALLLLGAGCATTNGRENLAPTPYTRPTTPSLELRVPVLLYHHIGETPPGDHYGLFVTTSTFQSQLQALADSGWHVIPLPTLLDALAGKGTVPEKSVVITFDDANADARGAVPVLAAFGDPATMFVMTGPVTNKSVHYLHWDELAAMRAAGWTLAPHTRYHVALTRVPEAEGRDEIMSSAVSIAAHVGASSTVFAYPDGLENEAVERFVADAGIRYAFTFHPGAVTTSSNPLALPRLRVGEDYPADKLLRLLDTTVRRR